MGQADRGREHRRRQHEHRRRHGVARGARRLHAVRRAARAADARPSAVEEPELQPARLGADHHAGQDRQRAVGPHQPSREHAPGADRLRQGQSGQAHVRDAGPDLDRASVGGAARSAGGNQDGGDRLSRRAAGADRHPRRQCRHVLRYARDLGAVASRRQAEDSRGRRSAARQGRARAADLHRGGRAGLPLDHLVRPGGAARHAGRAGAADQSRCGRDAAQPRGRRTAAKPVARSRRRRAPRKPRSSLPTRPRCGAR